MEDWANDLMREFPKSELGDLVEIDDPYVWTKESKNFLF